MAISDVEGAQLHLYYILLQMVQCNLAVSPEFLRETIFRLSHLIGSRVCQSITLSLIYSAQPVHDIVFIRGTKFV